MGDMPKLASILDWPQRLADWLADSGYLNPSLEARQSDSVPLNARQLEFRFYGILIWVRAQKQSRISF
jgi:hypothetical protein